MRGSTQRERQPAGPLVLIPMRVENNCSSAEDTARSPAGPICCPTFAAKSNNMNHQPNSDAAAAQPLPQMKFDVALPADVSAVSMVVDWIMRHVNDLQYGSDKEFEIEMALREALANAVVHGCKGDPTKKVECSVSGDRESGMLIVVRDPGTGFDPSSIPVPTEDANLHADHGRGILLINKLMDEVTHEQNGTVIRMRKF